MLSDENPMRQKIQKPDTPLKTSHAFATENANALDSAFSHSRKPNMEPLYKNLLRRTLLSAVAAVALTSCTSGYRGMVAEGNFASTVRIIPHYGRGIGIPIAYLNGGSIGSAGGWGGGGGGNCCVSMKNDSSKPLFVTVKWQTYRSDVDERRWHEETVPVNFAVPPGDGNGLNIHFLPGHHVQVWYSDWAASASAYPGPAYMPSPPPNYVPLPDEKPALSRE